MFDLPFASVLTLISTFIASNQIQASIDESETFVVMRRSEKLSRMEYLATHLAEKLVSLADANDKLLEAKSKGEHGFRAARKETRFKAN